MRYIICDIDGTIALKGDRDPFDWGKVIEDQPNKPVLDLLHALKWTTSPDYRVVIFTGRDAICKTGTEMWLSYYGISYHSLYMRPKDDKRDDRDVKKEMLVALKATMEKEDEIAFVLDDRNKVVKMWRDEGLTCLQVAEGDF